MTKKKTFGLVELIIVLAILLILFLLVFALTEKYQKTSRNAVRTSDIKQMLNSLEAYYIENFDYPLPSESIAIVDGSGALGVLGYQGIFDDMLKENKVPIKNIPHDPMTNDFYSYTRIDLGPKGVEIGTFLEDDSIFAFKIIRLGNVKKDVYVKNHYNVGDFGIFKLPYMMLIYSGSYLSAKDLGTKGIVSVNIRYKNISAISGSTAGNIKIGDVKILSQGNY